MKEYDCHINHLQEDGYLKNLSNEDKLLDETIEDYILVIGDIVFLKI